MWVEVHRVGGALWLGVGLFHIGGERRYGMDEEGVELPDVGGAS